MTHAINDQVEYCGISCVFRVGERGTITKIIIPGLYGVLWDNGHYIPTHQSDLKATIKATLTEKEWDLVLQSIVHRRLQTNNPDLKEKLHQLETKLDQQVYAK